MKKTVLLLIITFAGFTSAALFAAENVKRFEGRGEVTSADPLYGRVTIKHGLIKGFVGGEETEFFLASPGLLKGINKRDLVDFTVAETNGDTRLEKITKTGEAPPKEENQAVNNAVRDILTATGEAAKTVASPIAPAHEVVSGGVDATTGTTDAVLDNATLPETKKKF